MDGFKEFFTEAAELQKNLQDTLKKVPASHAKLIKGFKFKWVNDSTIPGDDDHVGIINPMKKTVTIAAPWNYGRGYTLCHELAHQVWAAYVSPEMKKAWSKIVKLNPDRDKTENDEENFCMAYACYYSKNKVTKHDCQEWMDFIKKLPK